MTIERGGRVHRNWEPAGQPGHFARLLPLLLLLAGLSVGAADIRYVLEVSSGTDGAAIAARHGWTVLRFWQSESHLSYSVAAAEAVTASTLAKLKCEPGFLELEADVDLRAAESDEASRAKAAPETLGSWFTVRDRSFFYGALVHDGYVHQPVAAIVRVDEAHRVFGRGAGVVAIIDTGVDTTHAALRDVLVPGYDFTRDRSDTVSELNDLDPATAAALQQSTVEILDSGRPAVPLNSTTIAILSQSTVEILDGKGLPKSFGHGTMVAGLVHRIAPEARIMPLKAFRADGSGALSDVVRAIRYAADHGAAVISMSFHFTARSPELESAIQYAVSHGVICIASAGNNAKETAVYPAAFKQVVGIGSTNYSDRRSLFSNWGASARTSAPGEALVTAFPGNTYAGVWGTSFSTALVSGAATIFGQIVPGLKPEVLKAALDYGVRIEQDMGDGRLDIVRSGNYLRKR